MVLYLQVNYIKYSHFKFLSLAWKLGKIPCKVPRKFALEHLHIPFDFPMHFLLKFPNFLLHAMCCY